MRQNFGNVCSHSSLIVIIFILHTGSHSEKKTGYKSLVADNPRGCKNEEIDTFLYLMYVDSCIAEMHLKLDFARRRTDANLYPPEKTSATVA